MWNCLTLRDRVNCYLEHKNVLRIEPVTVYKVYMKIVGLWKAFLKNTFLNVFN